MPEVSSPGGDRGFGGVQFCNAAQTPGVRRPNRPLAKGAFWNHRARIRQERLEAMCKFARCAGYLGLTPSASARPRLVSSPAHRRPRADRPGRRTPQPLQEQVRGRGLAFGSGAGKPSGAKAAPHWRWMAQPLAVVRTCSGGSRNLTRCAQLSVGPKELPTSTQPASRPQ